MYTSVQIFNFTFNLIWRVRYFRTNDYIMTCHILKLFLAIQKKYCDVTCDVGRYMTDVIATVRDL